jgi:NAD(P)-dependent dehydrogenase (short-subunit alcohol dehydrogenase family)
MGLLEGKVAVVSGAARGQGRAHALRLAREGADITAIDICADIDTVDYPLATPEDLDDTVAQIELLGRRIAASETDVRDATAVAAAIDTGAGPRRALDRARLRQAARPRGAWRRGGPWRSLVGSTSWSRTPGSRCTTQPTQCLRRAGAT